VTGPDEYTALVNNNCYTNLMAQAHLRYAAALARELAADAPSEYERLAGRIGLAEAEVNEWRQAADRMRIPRDLGLGIHLQDDTFLTRAAWDFAGTPASMYPLLLHFHPLVIYRHQVLKQPDVVLAQVLLGSRFSMAEKKRNFDYYDPLTTGDSSLSPCIQSVAAAELGYADLAYAYFMRTARMDLDDVNGNVSHGVHAAAMAGSWVSLVYGFAGLREDDGRISFAPRLPPAWTRLRFRMLIGAALLQVTLTSHAATYELLAGEALEVRHFGQTLRIIAGEPVTIDPGARLECVIFDLDGVITDTAEHHFRAWQRLAAEISLPFDRELNERLKGVSRMESLEIILEHAGRRTESLQDKVRLAERKNTYFRELIDAITPADLLPGIADLLVDLRAHGMKTAIASMSHNVWDVVGRLGIEPLIDLIVDPAALVKGKPDPEIFLAAAEQLGVRFENCVGIEDARAGVEAIKAARMVAVGIGRDLPGADWLVAGTGSLTVDALEARFASAHGPRALRTSG
jgi:alpha,alpha-trehalose phosphorylase